MKYLTLIFLSALILSGCTNQSLPSNNSGEPDTTSQKQSEPTATQIQSSLKELLNLGNSQRCTWESNEDGTQVKGEILVKGSQFKQITTISDNEGNMTINAIGDQQWIHTWNSKMPGGVKMNITTVTQNSASDNNMNNQVDLDKKVGFNCSPANISDADFTLPADIKFTDLTQTIDNIQKNMENFKPENFNLDQFKDMIPAGE